MNRFINIRDELIEAQENDRSSFSMNTTKTFGQNPGEWKEE